MFGIRNNKKDNEDKEKFPSAELMLSVLQKEYDNEAEREKSIESRTGIFMTFAGAILAFMPSTIKLPNVYKIQVKNLLEALPYCTLIILTVITFSTLVFSIICFIRVVSVKEYRRLTLDGFNESNAVYKKEYIALALMKEYQIVVKHNNSTNDKKIALFKRGIYCILIALVLLVIIYFISIFLNQ